MMLPSPKLSLPSIDHQNLAKKWVAMRDRTSTRILTAVCRQDRLQKSSSAGDREMNSKSSKKIPSCHSPGIKVERSLAASKGVAPLCSPRALVPLAVLLRNGFARETSRRTQFQFNMARMFPRMTQYASVG